MKYIKTYENSRIDSSIFKQIVRGPYSCRHKKKYIYYRSTSWRRLQIVSNMLNFESLLDELLLNKYLEFVNPNGVRSGFFAKKIEIVDKNNIKIYSREKEYQIVAYLVITIYYENYPEKGPLELDAEIILDANKFNI